MNKVLTFKTIDEAYNQIIDEYAKKNEATMTEIIGRWDRQKKEGCEKCARQLGDNLELTSIIDLEVQKGGYYQGQLFPQQMVAAINTNGSYGHRTIKKFAESSMSLIENLNKVNYGALVTPLFITIQTEELLIPDDAKLWLKQTLKTELENMPFMHRIFAKYLYWGASRTRIRGLNEKEIEQFERLYFKEETRR